MQKDGEGNQNESVIHAWSMSNLLHVHEKIWSVGWKERESTTVVFSHCVARWALNSPICVRHISEDVNKMIIFKKKNKNLPHVKAP